MDGWQNKIVDIRLAEKTGLFSNQLGEVIRMTSKSNASTDGRAAGNDPHYQLLTNIFFGAKR